MSVLFLLSLYFGQPCPLPASKVGAGKPGLAEFIPTEVACLYAIDPSYVMRLEVMIKREKNYISFIKNWTFHVVSHCQYANTNQKYNTHSW